MFGLIPVYGSEDLMQRRTRISRKDSCDSCSLSEAHADFAEWVGGLVGGGEGEVGEDEAVDVDPLVDDFGDGLAGAVAGSKSTTLKLQTTG